MKVIFNSNIYDEIGTIRVWFQITDKDGITWVDAEWY